jgi:acyl-CoA thioester hydrolase
MSRVKIKFPDEKPLFTATISVRINDINYGGHVGNDAILTIVHEARMLMLASNGYTEMKAGGNSMIMADTMLAYKNEAFYGDVLNIDIYATEITRLSFDLLYRVSVAKDGKQMDIAHVKTGMVCFDYDARKVVAMTAALQDWLQRR